MVVWCEAFCCRHIYFKTVFQSASEHAVFIQKIGKFSGGGAQPPLQTLPQRRTHHLGAYGALTVAPSALNPCPFPTS